MVILKRRSHKNMHNKPVNSASKLAGTSMASLVLRFNATLTQNNQYHSGPLPGRYEPFRVWCV